MIIKKVYKQASPCNIIPNYNYKNKNKNKKLSHVTEWCLTSYVYIDIIVTIQLSCS